MQSESLIPPFFHLACCRQKSQGAMDDKFDETRRRIDAFEIHEQNLVAGFWFCGQLQGSSIEFLLLQIEMVGPSLFLVLNTVKTHLRAY